MKGDKKMVEGENSVNTKVIQLKETLGPSWEVREGDPSNLVGVVSDGVIDCVDGRKPEVKTKKTLRGPKVQGGTLGIAMLMAKKEGLSEITEDVFRKACQVSVDEGFKPGVHDMSGEHGVHCGHCKLMMQGYFKGQMPDLAVEPEEMVRIVKEYGGQELKLEGKHEEQVVRLNYREGTTLEPNVEAFNLDVWFIEKLGLSVDDLLGNAANTVVGLNGPQKIEVIE